MNEYISNIGTVMILVAIANILIPDTGIKKFASLSMGFIMIAAAIVPVSQIFPDDGFSIETFETDESVMAEAENNYRKEVLSRHSENIKQKIYGHIKYGSQVDVSVDDNGDITEVSIIPKGDESAAVAYIVGTLKLPRERIKIKYENN